MSSENDTVISIKPPPEYLLQTMLKPIKNINPKLQVELRYCYNRIFIDIPNYLITINELKEIIYKKLNYINPKLYLHHNQLYLDDKKTLQEYNINNTTIIYMKVDQKINDAQNTDDFIMRYKGSAPICSETERKAVLESCVYVDQVIMNVGDSDSKIAIESVSPDYIVIGSDWAKKDYYKQMGFDQDWLDKNDIGLCYVPYTKAISSSDIKKRMS